MTREVPQFTFPIVGDTLWNLLRVLMAPQVLVQHPLSIEELSPGTKNKVVLARNVPQ